MYDQQSSIASASTDELVLGLQDPDSDYRYTCAGILTERSWHPYNAYEAAMWAVAAQAWDALVTMGHAAIPACAAVLDDENFYIRTTATLTLGEIGDPEVLPFLNKMAQDPNHYVRTAAIKALGGFGEHALPILSLALLDEERHVRREAATTLAKFGAQAVPNLIQALYDSDWYSRREVADGLLQIGQAAVQPLINLLSDDHIGHDAAQILRDLGITPERYGYYGFADTF